jgi:hypothetical protein
MARIRTIKPEFFQHESLYDAERESELPLRIAFAGLWTVADKAGRFEWRPRQLKLNVLPYDECDFTAVLSALEAHGFVQRYDVEGKSFGCIPSWDRHQHKNVREPDSTIPAPPWQVQAPDEAGASTGQVPAQAAGKGREGKGREGEGAAAAPPPDGLDVSAWKRWQEYRVEIRKPLKSISLPAAQRELAAFGRDQGAVVEQSIAHGWQGLFELKSKTGGKRQIDPPPKRPPPTEEQMSAERRKAAEANRRELAAKVGVIAEMPR